MRNKKLKIILLLLLTGCFTGVWAQEAILATSSEAAGSGGTVSYSVGQIAYTSQAGSNGSVLQGVQQPYEIFSAVGIENANIKLEMSAFPNPTTDNLTLTINDLEFSNLTFQVFDVNGKLLQGKKIAGNQTAIDFGKYSSGIYFLKIMQGKVEIKSFKVIKN